MSRSSNQRASLNRSIYILLTVFILFYVGYKVAQGLWSSVIFQDPDRVNVVFYSENPVYFSLSELDGQNYRMSFSSDTKIEVPGGYGQYRVGAIGKLASLEAEPAIIGKAFTSATSSFVHYYFYPGTDEVYYGKEIGKNAKPSFQTLLLGKSNGSIIDRMYLLYAFSTIKNHQFNTLYYQQTEQELTKDIIFEDDAFTDKAVGLFFQKKLREEGRSVQIQYDKSYQTASKIAQILEGNGIRVNDINTSTDNERGENCLIIREEEGDIGLTEKELATFFSCEVATGNTDVYDTIFYLGDVEERWEIRK